MPERLEKLVALEWAEIEKNLAEQAVVFRSHAVFDSISSTNDWALQQCGDVANLPAVCLAEMQHQGRGRRGREWVSPSSANIYMSVAWSIPLPVAELAPLSLVIGVAIVRALQVHALAAGLKWPNDVMLGGKKMAGILIESRIRNPQITEVVIGLGVNFHMDVTEGVGISQSWTDFMREYDGKQAIDRNRLAADILRSLIEALNDFVDRGFAVFSEAWHSYDVCRGKMVEVIYGGNKLIGEALGVDDNGALKVRIGDQVQVFYSADVSLRLQV